MLVLLGVLVLVYHLGLCIYYAMGLEPLPTFQFLYSGGFLCGVVWWLRAEINKSPVQQVYCSGLLVGMGWLVVIPYHLLKTRGVQGLLLLFALFGFLFGAEMLSAIVYITFSYQ